MKKFLSVLSALLIFAMCGFFTACGDKYSKMEYKIWYAYSQDALDEDWIDGTDGITINYDEEEIDNDYNIYIKVDISGVKSKHVDDIIVSKIGTAPNLAFTSEVISEGEILPIHIMGHALSSLKFYETNSGKVKTISFNVYRNLDSIEVNHNIKPAVVNGDSISLAGLDNITYHPEGLTNQMGVSYKIISSGAFGVDNQYIARSTSVDGININGASITPAGILSVEGFSVTRENYIIEVQAISIFADIDDDGNLIVEDADLAQSMYIYVVDSLPNTALKLNYVTEDSNNEIADDEFVTLYTNSPEYSSTIIKPDFSSLTTNPFNIYATGVNTINNTSQYAISIYVDGELYGGSSDIVFGEEYHGIIIEDMKDGTYKITATKSASIDVDIEFALEIADFTFKNRDNRSSVRKSITVTKQQLAEAMTFNGVLYSNGDIIEQSIYSTSSTSYSGLKLTLHAVPTEEKVNQIIRVSSHEKIVITGVESSDIKLIGGVYQIPSGSTINIKFTSTNITEDIELIFSMVSTPSKFNGEEIVPTDIDVKLKLTNKVTADKIEFLSNITGTSVSNMYIDSAGGSYVYAKVYYTGSNLDLETITLTSENESIKFANGLTNISLSNLPKDYVVDSFEGNSQQSYIVYQIPIDAVVYGETGLIRIDAGGGTVGVTSAIQLTSVLLADEDEFKFVNTNGNASMHSDTQYSISSHELVEFEVIGKTKSSIETKDVIVDITLESATLNDLLGSLGLVETYLNETNYATNTLTFDKLNSNAFSVRGQKISTQAIKVNVSYYVKDRDTNEISVSSKDIYLELAVYNAIANISVECADTNISYINDQFSEAGTTTVSFDVYDRNNTIPSKSVVFSNKQLTNATGVLLSINANVLLNTENIRITYGTEDITTSILSANGMSVYEFDATKLKVELLNNVSIGDFTINLIALRFGAISSSRGSITINIVKAAKVSGIELVEYNGGNVIHEESNNSNYAYMSFMRTEGDYTELQFLARAYYETNSGDRYDDLTYELYAAQYDSNNELIYDNGIARFVKESDPSLEISMQRITISGLEYQLFTIRAYKVDNGGLFKLVIASKDSYSIDSNSIAKYNTTNEIFIDISDGSERNPYIISSAEDFRYINNDLTKHYVLVEDIVIEGTIENIYSPIGLIRSSDETVSVDQFTGSLRGTKDHLTSSGTTISGNIRTITFKINNYIETVAGTYDYFGLFASVGVGAVIEDLNLVIDIDVNNETITDSFTNTTYFGSLAGRNAGSINNITMTISGTFIHSQANSVFFGGLVGENISKIDNINVDNSNGLLIESNTATSPLYIGLLTGKNSGYINGKYEDKYSLNSLKHDIVANMNIYNAVEKADDVSPALIYVGGVSGLNTNSIENLLIGGQISILNKKNADNDRFAYLAGVAGLSISTDNAQPNIIKNCVAIGLDLTHETNNGAVAGIVANSENVELSNVSYLSAVVKYYNAGTFKGKIKGSAIVSGIVANATEVDVEYATVENFIGSEFYTLEATSIEAEVAGLAYGSASVNASLVNANVLLRAEIKEDIINVSNILTIAQDDASYSYFVGEIKAVDNSKNNIIFDNVINNVIFNNLGNSTYVVTKINNQLYVNNTKVNLNSTTYISAKLVSSESLYKMVDISSAFVSVIDPITEDTFTLSTYYTFTDGVYSLVQDYADIVNGSTYFTLDADIWSELNVDLFIVDANTNNLVAYNSAEYSSNVYYTCENVDITKYYILDNGYYIKNVSDKINLNINYYTDLTINIENYESYITTLVNDDNNLTWLMAKDVNAIAIDNIDYYFPYIAINSDPLMVIKPTRIEVSADNTVVESIGSQIIDQNNPNIVVTDNVLINYHNYINPLNNNEYNTYTLLDIVENDEVIEQGLINLKVIPPQAQGGVIAEVYSGSATISNNKITFLGVSGKEPIIIRFYSVFNPDLQEFVAFYTQLGITDLLLESGSVEAIENENYDYIMSTYTGASKTLIGFSGENIYKDKSFDTLLDSQLENLMVEATSEYGIVNIENTSMSNMGGVAISCSDFAGDSSSVEDLVTFNLKIKLSALYDVDSDEYITLASTKLKVVVYKSATNVEITTGDIVASTGTTIGINVNLYTGYIDEDATDTESMNCVPNGNQIDLEYYNNVYQDSIRIQINPKSNEDLILINELLSQAKVTNIIELFDVIAIYSPIKTGDNVIGYNYVITLALKDDHNYRYITENINFELKVLARTNGDICDNIDITFNPQELNTMRIENYTATTIQYESTYVNLFESNQTETSIISPGSIGGIMMIYLEPSYSNVKNVELNSSSLFVPSLGYEVKIIFEQIVRTVDSTGKVSYRTIYPSNELTDNGIVLQKVSGIDKDGKTYYDGTIYIHTQLDEFKGYNGNLTATLSVETESGVNKEIEKHLLTEYLPGATLSYDGTVVENGYLIQNDTYLNTIDLKLFGYEFNTNPVPYVEWAIDSLDGDLYAVSANGQTLTEIVTSTTYEISNYVQVALSRDIANLQPNDDGSYTLPLYLNVYNNVPAPFKVGARLSLTTEDDVITSDDNQELIFYPTDYVVTDVIVDHLVNGTFRVGINSTEPIDLIWSTLNGNRDYSSTIIADLIFDLEAEYAEESKNNPDALKVNDRLLNLFKLNGYGLSVDPAVKHPEFNIKVADGRVVITGVSTINEIIEFEVYYGYIYNNETGKTEIKFGTTDNMLNYTMAFSFNLNVQPMTSEEVPEAIYTAQQFMDMKDNENYILMNDIVLEEFTPITAKIASLDGNNRVIKIKSFAVTTNRTNYGLFDSISSYTDINNKSQKTILKNVIVDYSQFTKLELTNNEITNVVFGGLVANNAGGLIYNSDVVNMGISNKVINIIVDNSNNVKVTFGGLVGTNSGIITNSRVGTSTYVEINADETGDHISNHPTLGSLEFVIGNMTEGAEQGFVAVAGGFVGTNSGVISTSYMANTSLVNYSTAPDTGTTTNYSMTAGFVAENDGDISYSYVKAQEDSITLSTPRATGNKIENKTNGNVAGFVYENGGEISNSYANTVLITDSAFMAGFVYKNIGTIRESYSACTLGLDEEHTSAEQPFVGIDAGDNLLSTGTLENCYYYETEKDKFNVIIKEGKDHAIGYNRENFTNSEALNGFVFVLSDNRNERDQGVWSFYNAKGNYTVLPELANANIIARSNRYEITTIDGELAYTNAINYAPGSANNPYIIRNVEEYNSILASDEDFIGYVRFINNIDFGEDATSIKTRVRFTLGDKSSQSVTSIEGNGMTISGIYLDVNNSTEDTIGLFSEIYNSYIKNLNLKFAQPTNTDDQFSSLSAIYSGGLAGKMHDTVAINIDLLGENTTIAGNNFAGGLAGLITGESLIYGIESNLSVVAVKQSTNAYLYYDEDDFRAQKSIGVLSFSGNYSDASDASYIKLLSYAGGLAGVIDITNSKGNENNLSYITIDGTTMHDKTNGDKANNANILADYAGGVAGYINENTYASRVKFNVGVNNRIKGQYVAGGLFAVSLGNIETSQVTAVEDTQYTYDSTIGEYIIALANNDGNPKLNSENIGNKSLIEGYGFAGGLVGLSIYSDIAHSYSKATFTGSAEAVGGLIGVSVADTISYSYAVPYVDISSYIATDYTSDIGGLVGRAYGSDGSSSISRNTAVKEYISVLNNIIGVAHKSTELMFTFSTTIIDNNKLDYIGANNVTIDYIAADYREGSKNFIKGSNNSEGFVYVFAGLVEYSSVVTHSNLDRANDIPLRNLYDITHEKHDTDFQAVFSGWSTTYWTLDPDKYFPLLLKEEAENYIYINGPEDLFQIKSKPDGNFKVTTDINMSQWCQNEVTSNYVFDVNFTGTIVGERNDNTGNNNPPILYNIFIDAKYNTGAGFFRSTNTASISNLIFSWGDSSVKDEGHYNGIEITNTVATVGMITESDTESLFTGLIVGVNLKGEIPSHEGVLVNTGDHSIDSFGGIIGTGIRSTINACQVVSGINVSLSDTNADKTHYVGGLVGHSNGDVLDGNVSTRDTTTDTETTDNQYKFIIMTSSVNAGNKSKIEFNVKINNTTAQNLYYGGAVGRAENTSISSTHIGDKSLSIKYVNLSLDIDGYKYDTFLGGVVGYNDQSKLSSVSALTNIKLLGKVTENNVHNIAGLVGEFKTSTELAIEDSYVSTNIDLGYLLKNVGNNIYYPLQINNLRVAGSIASAQGTITISRSVFTGMINTLDSSEVKNIYAGGMIAYAGAGANVKIEQSLSSVDMLLGTKTTDQIYAGGFIGKFGDNISVITLNVMSSISTGRIDILNSNSYIDETSNKYFIGGLFGDANNVSSITMSSIISTSSILTSGMSANTVQAWNKGAIFAKVNSNANIDNSTVFYSSDVALAPEDSGLGTNLAAYDLFYGDWSDFVDNNADFILASSSETKLPIIKSLISHMQTLSLIISNNGNYSYVSGSAFSPIQINSTIRKTFSAKDTFAYYLISSNIDTLNFSGELNGILIGAETVYTFTTFEGILSDLGKRSAISNIHIKVDTQGTIKSGIVDTSNGTIFNSSVQGTGLTLSGENVGLIANTNSGLVSHSYSTAEITNVTCNSLGGIVNTNNTAPAKIDTCYFTGYIANTQTATAAGIVNNASSKGFIYNTYMAGVIEVMTYSGMSNNKNSFVYTLSEGSANSIGANNYIDSLANVESLAKVGEDGYIGVTTVQPSDIMSYNNIKGEWYDAVRFTDNGIKLDINNQDENSSYGYNYGYPVYNFYKDITGGEVAKYQLYTGTGTGTSIYSATNITNGTAQFDDYKIPHLGVLDSVRSVASEGLKLQLIYDIDKPVTWRALGDTLKIVSGVQEKSIRGFDVTKVNSDGTTSDEIFNGQFISNKYYNDLPFNNELAMCKVAGLSNHGLFANINSATIAYLDLGSFSGLVDSGPLGVNVVKGESVVHDIDFTKDTNITGKGNVGALFGSISGDVNIYRLFKDEIYTPTIYDATSIGLIAGNMTDGTISVGIVTTTTTQQSVITTSEYIENWSVKFGNSQYAGGLIGQMTGGNIKGVDTGLSITVMTNSDSNNIPTCLGGVIGISGKDGESTTNIPKISNVTVTFNLNNNINAKSFGGLVAITNIDTMFTNCAINAGTADQKVKIVNGELSFGIIAAELKSGTLVVDGFNLSKDAKFSYNITNDGEFSGGVGALVGYQKSNLAISMSSSFNPTISTNAKNLGGISGVYEGGLFYIVTSNDEYFATIQGTENVGGAFGLVKSNAYNTITDDNGVIGYYLVSNTKSNGMEDKLSNLGIIKKNDTEGDTESQVTSFIGDGFNFLASDKAFANIQLRDADEQQSSETYKNFGGLFGYYSSDLGVKPVDNIAVEKLKNSNTLTFNSDRKYSTIVMNVGGIVGSFDIDGLGIYGVNNQGGISVVESDIVNTEDTITYANIDTAKTQQYTPLLINVGGIVGYANNTTIQDCTNTAVVMGYQNVGGIVGYASNTTITNVNTMFNSTTVTGLTNETADNKIYFDENYQYVNSLNSNTSYYTLNTASNSNTITGVMNVGGVIGVANNATITQTWNSGKIYGNTSVGGLIGYNNGSNVTQSYVGKNNKEEVSITATYYAINRGNNTSGLIAKANIETFIPTSVGGLIGSVENGVITNSTVYGVNITSAKEGRPYGSSTNSDNLINSSVISTVSNSMADLRFVSADDNNEFISATDPYIFELDKDNNTVNFNDQTSGFGGFIGSIDSDTMAAIDQTNALNANISTQLGVNVGTVYGYAVALTGSADASTSVSLKTPNIYGDIYIDGAYNIGGVVGYIETTGILNSYSSNSNLAGEASITLQSDSMGMYVGGLFGKIKADTVDNLLLDNTNGTVKIDIDTSMSYYIGGLVGRLEGTNIGFDGSIDGQVTRGNIEDSSTNENFGGLIGMLKVGSKSGGVDVHVTGSHSYAFTINTIENENYYDGESYQSASLKNDTDVYLTALASYANLDRLNICATSDSSWYAVGVTNPVNPLANGWHKDYTGFKTIQRCIPQSQNNGAPWDSIAVIYDAANITHVATIASLKNDGVIDGNNHLGEADGSIITDKYYDDNYICYTIYEEADGSPKLYSAMGIAELYTNISSESVDSSDKYLAPSNGEYLQTQYGTNMIRWIDCNNAENGLQALTYFVYADKNSEEWKQYKDIAGENAKYVIKNNDKMGIEKIETMLCYQVKNYLGSTNDTNHPYFAFKSLYANATIKNINKNAIWENTDEDFALSGSLFEVYGYTDSDVENLEIRQEDYESTIWDWLLLILGVIAAVTPWPDGIFVHGARLFKIGWQALRIAGAFVAMAQFSKMASMNIGWVEVNGLHNSIKNDSYGFISSSYTRLVQYEDGKMVADVDSYYTLDDTVNNEETSYTYFSFSNVRPADYYIEYYFYIDDNGVVHPYSYDKEGIKLIDGSKYTYSYTIDGEIYELYRKYIYANSTYYIHSLAMQSDPIRTQDFFSSNNYIVYNNTITSNYILTDAYYSYGAYLGEGEYAIGNETDSEGKIIAADPNNNITATLNADGSYSYYLNGKEIRDNRLVEQPTNITFNYSPYTTLDDYDAGEGEFAQDTSKFIEGYDYVQGVYYTANGNKDTGLNPIVRTFTYYGADLTDPSILGREGMEYITRPYSYTVEQEDETYIKYEGTLYYTITSNAGTFALDIDRDMEAYNSMIYNDNPAKIIEGTDDYTIDVNLYPSSHINPYISYDNAVDVKSKNIYFNSNIISNDNPEHTITLSAEYYYVDGGYVNIDNNVYEDLSEKADTSMVVTRSGGVSITLAEYTNNTNNTNNPDDLLDMEYEDGKTYRDILYYQNGVWYYNNEFVLYNSDSETTNVKYTDLLVDLSSDGSNDYAGYYWLDPSILNNNIKDKFLVSNAIQNIEGNLYGLSMTYFVGEEGFLEKIDLEAEGSNGDYSIDYNYNKYLANTKYQIYTRYKYKFNIIDEWLKDDKKTGYYLITQNGSVNGGKTTYFVESVKVILSGCVYNEGTKTEIGTITIS